MGVASPVIVPWTALVSCLLTVGSAGATDPVAVPTPITPEFLAGIQEIPYGKMGETGSCGDRSRRSSPVGCSSYRRSSRVPRMASSGLVIPPVRPRLGWPALPGNGLPRGRLPEGVVSE